MAPCVKVCGDAFNKEDETIKCIEECNTNYANCNNECRFLFSASDENLKGNYIGYALDVNSIKFRDLNKDIDKYRSFVCRFEPSKTVLDAAPITTRYFRVRARYNYLLENSVSVNVEQLPVTATQTVPDQLAKTALEFQVKPSIWFQGLSSELVSAIASVESGMIHCCQDANKRDYKSCIESGEKDCPSDKIITSGSSVGIMQVRYYSKDSKYQEKIQKEVNNIVNNVCDVKNIFNYECNVRVGMVILKSKYDEFKNGCKSTKIWQEQNWKEYPTFLRACQDCVSPKGDVRYDSYTGYRAAIRGYNGWGCDNRFDRGYVEKVLDAMKTVKGKDIIDPTTLKSIFREGEGMLDPTPTQSEENVQTSQKPSPPHNVKSDYYSTGNFVDVLWTKPLDAQPDSYRVTRYIEGSAGDIIEPAREICDIKSEINKVNYQCVDNNPDYGKTYTYSVIAYFSTGEISEAKTTVEIS